jgi:NAD(P)H-dependent FMN reductase
MNIALILTSVRENRLAESVFAKVKELIGTRFKFTLIDPLEYDLPLLNKRYFEMNEPEEKFRKLHNIFNECDGFIIITAEYNHGVPPAIKNMLDHFGKEFNYKSCGIISYSDGPIGGARSTEQLRNICATLGMPPIPSSPAWGLAHKADQPAGKSFVENFEKNFKVFIEQFLWYTEAYMNQKTLKQEKKT